MKFTVIIFVSKQKQFQDSFFEKKIKILDSDHISSFLFKPAWKNIAEYARNLWRMLDFMRFLQKMI